MKNGILWLVEVRDSRDEAWEPLDYTASISRADARQHQWRTRSVWKFTRIVKYVREAQ
ncbi:hypothetical protein J2W88_003938 [Acidovorax delafieldii]|uniref:Uncharacterized protein n=1 Tax=Acidovorax delafieldii TaxID=47920 RepID=A0AAJ2BV71_ACIDE|nr:hypothetical protein [Acidovorax delafieldii]MDR6837349.1 hypothetical protein [Acidovorax delafieldii]MDR7366840.1 hypothetical protein [Acidovorax delafieldii]